MHRNLILLARLGPSLRGIVLSVSPGIWSKGKSDSWDWFTLTHAPSINVSPYSPLRDSIRRSITGFGNWDLPQKKLHKGKIWDFGTFLGPFLYLSGTFSRYFHKNAAKLAKSKKGFKNRVVTTFNAKLTLFGDHFWAFIPNLHQMKIGI